MSRTALIIGATGLVGNACLQLLLQTSEYRAVKALTRRALPQQHAKLTPILANFDELDKVAHELVADDVFYCLGTTIKKAGSEAAFRQIDYDYALRIAEIARQNGAQQFLLVSSLGANAQSSIFYSRVKGELETALQTYQFAGLHIFRPSILLGERHEQRTGEAIGQFVARCLNPLMLGALRKYRGIDAPTVAKTMVKCAIAAQRGVFVYESDKIQALAV
jgi:uncharacterized protein YbjT (DUF2867 family)